LEANLIQIICSVFFPFFYRKHSASQNRPSIFYLAPHLHSLFFRLLLFRSTTLRILNLQQRRVASTSHAISALPARCKFNDSADNRETTYGRKVAIYLREDITGFAFNSLATFHQPRLTPDRVTRLPCKVTPDLPALPSFYR